MRKSILSPCIAIVHPPECVIIPALHHVYKQSLKMGRFCIITYTPVGYHLKEVNKECKCGYNIPFSKDIATSKVGFSPRD